MKTQHSIRYTLPAAVSFLSLTLCALAQPPHPPGGPGRPGRPGGPGGPGRPQPPLAGDMAPLGPLADKFQAFQRAQLHGETFYLKEEAELQQLHAATYHKITDFLLNDKITEVKGHEFVTRLIAIGGQHRAAVAAGEMVNTQTSLDDLTKAVTADARSEILEAELTPTINKVQLVMDEFVLFAEAEEKLASKAASLKRRLEGFIEEETDAKKDRKVTDREREKLAEAANETWVEFLKVVKR